MFYLSSQWGVLQKYLGSSDSSLFQTTGILSFLLLREKILKKSYFLISVLVVLGLCCYMQAFSHCGEQELLSSCKARASHCGGFSCGGVGLKSLQDSAVVARGLSCSAACGIFPDQGLNLCSLRWQADSYPLDQQASS